MPTTELARIANPSLFELEEGLVALLDTEAIVSPEQQAEFERDLAEQLRKTVAKRDKVAAFRKHLDSQIALAKEEKKRIGERQQVFENVKDRLDGYVLDVIQGLEPDAKGKLRKLEGEKFTLSARACPVSLEITDESLIPLAYKTVTVTMSAVDWQAIRRYLEDSAKDDFEANYSVDNAAVKAVLTGPLVPCERCNAIGMIEGAPEGQASKPEQCPVCHGACGVAPTVPGADLVIGKLSLQVR